MKQLPQTLSSLEVSEMICKNHKNLIRSIETYIKHFTELKIELSEYFTESTYKDASGKSNKCYNITKKGCELIAHKLTGIKGTEFTVKFIERFHDMEQALQQDTQPPQLPQKETYMLKNSKTWFQRNNWKMKMICECFDWERKYLYHKILSELSDIYNLDAIERMYIDTNGHKPKYKMELLDYFYPLQDTAEKYIDYLLGETEE